MTCTNCHARTSQLGYGIWLEVKVIHLSEYSRGLRFCCVRCMNKYFKKYKICIDEDNRVFLKDKEEIDNDTFFTSDFDSELRKERIKTS